MVVSDFSLIRGRPYLALVSLKLISLELSLHLNSALQKPECPLSLEKALRKGSLIFDLVGHENSLAALQIVLVGSLELVLFGDLLDWSLFLSLNYLPLESHEIVFWRKCCSLVSAVNG